MTIDDAHIRPLRRGFLKGVGAGNTARSGFRPVLAVALQNAARRSSPTPRASVGEQLTASRFVESAAVHRRSINQEEVLS